MNLTEKELSRIVSFIMDNKCDDLDTFMEKTTVIRSDINKRLIGDAVFFMAKYKVLIAGSRKIDNIDISKYIPENVDLIISGGAKGIDTLAERYADEHRISKMIMRPDYEEYGKRAPIIRNREMVNMCDEVIAFWDGKSRGTKSTIDYAMKKGKELKVIDINKE